jgi:hypothetical protein
MDGKKPDTGKTEVKVLSRNDWTSTARRQGRCSRGVGLVARAGPNTTSTFYVGVFVKSWVGGAKGRATLKGTLG